MSLASRIAARSRRPTATVRLNGRRWLDVLSLSRDQSFGQGMSAGEVLGRNPPVEIVEGETQISWTWGYDRYEVAGFSGIVTKILNRSYPNQISLQVADPLWLADVRRGDQVASPINNVAARVAIEQFLTAAGVTHLSIPALPASGSAWAGSEWILGTLTPVRFDNTTALAAAQSICEVLGYWLYADASGMVRATQLERRPSDSPVRTLRWEQDFLLAGPPDRERDAASVRNRAVVRGANTGVQGAQISDVWQTGAADRTIEYSSPLIEYVNEAQAGAASATAVAKRILKVWSRQPNVIRVGRIKADPRLSVGQTVAVQCPQIGYSSPKPFFIYGLNTTLDLRKGDFAQSLVLDGGTGDQGYTTVPPPAASFSWRIVRETLNGVGVVELFLDGTGSQSLGGGEVVSYAWATSTPTALGTPAVATGPQAMFVFPAATTTADVTLTVTDTSSKTGTITQTIPLAGDATTQPTSQVISVALGSAWAVTPDGGQIWNVEATGDATLVPEIGGQLIATREAGATGLRGSQDALASASTNLADLGGAITALWQTERTPDRVWAAVGVTLHRSIDGGATFAVWGTLPAPITAILEDPAVLNSVFVLAGSTMYHSTIETPGTAWAPFYAGPVGAVARHVVRGDSGATTWIAYTGSFIGSPLQRVEGPITALFPVVSPVVSEIRALALSSDELTVYAWDQAGRIWRVDSATGVATASAASLPAGETAQHALHDPDNPIVYLAAFGVAQGPVYKYFPLADNLQLFYQPAAGQQAHRIGIGGPRTPTGEGILLLTDGATPGGVWQLADALWTLKNSGLPVGWRWMRIAVSPANSSDWLITGWDGVGYDRSSGEIRSGGQAIIWRTQDAGLSWSSIPMVDIADVAPSATFLGAATLVGYTSTGQPYVIGAYAGLSVYLWRGSPLDGVAVLGPGGGYYPDTVGGQDGDILLVYIETSARLGYIAAGANSITPGAATAVNARLARFSPTTRAVAVGIGTIAATADYRGGSLGATIDGGGGPIAGIASGALFVGGRADGILRVDGLLDGAPTSQVVAAAGIGVAAIASDAQTRSAVAALLADGSVASSADGETWTVLPGPVGTILTTSVIAVIVRQL
jgi:hypothetical protein